MTEVKANSLYMIFKKQSLFLYPPEKLTGDGKTHCCSFNHDGHLCFDSGAYGQST
jgi:hypothetical protein